MFSKSLCWGYLVWYLAWRCVNAQSTLVNDWSGSQFVLPNNDEWTVYGYLSSLNPSKLQVFGGVKFPRQHYSFDLKTQGVNHFRNVDVPMNCHVQPVSLSDRTFFMNDQDTTFYSIDLISFGVRRLTQPSRRVKHVCIAHNTTHLFMLGGRDSATNAATNNVQVYNLRTERWLNVNAAPRMLQARFDFSCGIDPNTHRLYAIGGQITQNTFTAQIEFINTRNIGKGKWRKFKFSLSTPMALYNNAMVPTIIAQANQRRRLIIHEVTSSSNRIIKGDTIGLNTRRRMQVAPPVCSSPVDTIIVVDESCGQFVEPAQCDRFKGHLFNLVTLYNSTGSTRFGIIAYRTNSAINYLDLSQGTNRQVVFEAINGLECGNGTVSRRSDLYSGVDSALRMFSSNERGVPKSLIVYPICLASTGEFDFVCRDTSASTVQLYNISVSVYASGSRTRADRYSCLVNGSQSLSSGYPYEEYFHNNPEFSPSQYAEDARVLETTLCPPMGDSFNASLNTSFNFIQLVIAGGYTGQCCPPDEPECTVCSNPRTVWSVNVTDDPTDLLDPCIAARYYNESDIECGVVDQTMNMALGRQGARLIYYDCDVNGPTLWVFGGRENDTMEGATLTFTISDPITDAYDTCPVQEPPVDCPPRNNTNCPCDNNSDSDSDADTDGDGDRESDSESESDNHHHHSESDSDHHHHHHSDSDHHHHHHSDSDHHHEHQHKWWLSLDSESSSSSSSSSSDNSFSNFHHSREHWH